MGSSNKNLISVSKIREERYNYPRKLVQEIVEPIGARKKPSESVLQQFVKKTSNFDPNIVLSIFYHLLGDSQTEWLSKYRAMVCLENLMTRNQVYRETMNGVKEEYIQRISNVCEGFSFAQKSHGKLIEKMKVVLLGLIQQEGKPEGSQKTGFDFVKMNEMISQMDSKKRIKKKQGDDFLSQMNFVKSKAKKGKIQNQSLDILDMNINPTQPISSSLNPTIMDDNLYNNKPSSSTKVSNTNQADDLMLDFTNPLTDSSSNQKTQADSSNGIDLLDLDFTIQNSNTNLNLNNHSGNLNNFKNVDNKQNNDTSKYDEFDFL